MSKIKFSVDQRWLPQLWSRAQRSGVEVEKYLAGFDDQFDVLTSIVLTPDEKIEFAKWVIRYALTKFKPQQLTVAWTGGKDSTLILWLVREVIRELGLPLPRLMFINEGLIFDEIREFVDQLTQDWQLEVDEVKNQDVLAQVSAVGDEVNISRLNQRNQDEIRRLDYHQPTFNFEPESYLGNHVMKTVAMNQYLEANHYQAVMTGIRWDEQGARQNESFFSLRGDKHTPDHWRVHPILHLTESDVWQVIRRQQIPTCSLYEQGYRSLGAKGSTTKVSHQPAWEQDLAQTSERAGRRQDKEKIMSRLRQLGYM